MYIYHFWALCMHCKKTTTIRCFLEATYDLLVVLRKPWICTLCFDAHFSKFRDFDDFWPFLIGKMDILDLFWGPQTASCPKVTIYLPLNPRALLRTLTYFHHFGTPFEGPGGRVAARPRTSCLWAGGPAQSLTNPCPGPQILVILTTFGPPVRPRKWPYFAHFGP